MGMPRHNPAQIRNTSREVMTACGKQTSGPVIRRRTPAGGAPEAADTAEASAVEPVDAE